MLKFSSSVTQIKVDNKTQLCPQIIDLNKIPKYELNSKKDCPIYEDKNLSINLDLKGCYKMKLYGDTLAELT